MIVHVNGERFIKRNPDDLIRLLDGKAHENQGTIEQFYFEQASEFIRRGDYDAKGENTIRLDGRRGRETHRAPRKRTQRFNNRKTHGKNGAFDKHENQTSENPEDAEEAK